MASTGAKFPGSGATVDRSGLTAWTDAGNITADDASVASCTAASGTDYLVASGFDFSAIPDNATILGITVNVEWQETSAGGDNGSAQLQSDASTLIGSSKSAEVSAGFAVETFGSASDTWSATLTAATVKSADFGVRVWFETASTSEVDYITMTVEYVPSGGLFFGML